MSRRMAHPPGHDSNFLVKCQVKSNDFALGPTLDLKLKRRLESGQDRFAMPETPGPRLLYLTRKFQGSLGGRQSFSHNI
jgi:hypothetical protein